jgi:uncharacterized protein YihD (DUF1040 family)
MENLVNNYLESFRELLCREAGMVKSLLGLEEEKYDALKQVAVKDLVSINTREEDILQFMDGVERQRKELLLLLARAFGFEPETTLSQMLAKLPDDPFAALKGELSALRDDIKGSSGKLQVTMKENSGMVRANLEIINLTLQFANRHAIKETYDYRSRRGARENITIINQIA